MHTLEGIVKDGRIVLDAPADLPEGTRVKIVPVGEMTEADEDGPATAEVIAARLALMDQLEPGWLSPEDEAAWQEALWQQKEFQKATFFERAEKLRRMWE